MSRKFVIVKCEKCKNEQTIFEKPSTKVKCLVCSELLAVPGSEMKGKIIGTAK